MAVGAVQAGYGAYSYPAKAKSQEAGADFSSFAPGESEAEKQAFAPGVPEAGKQAFGQGVPEVGKQAFALSVSEVARQVFGQEKPKEDALGMDYQEFIREKIEELWVKFQNGESEPSYQIGAASFTEKEWDKLLEKFDALEEEIRTQMREEHAKRAKEQEESQAHMAAAQHKAEMAATKVGEAGESPKDTAATKASEAGGLQTAAQKVSASSLTEQETNLLAGDYTTATYPGNNPEDAPIRYITCYTEEGIFCRRVGQTQGYAWEIRFEGKEQYEKAMQFLGQFPSDWNLLFASRENFWQDFLDDKIDLDSFQEFLNGTDKGVPDYTITVGDSVFIDRDKAQWAKYMNQEIGKFYTAQEMEQMQAEQMLSEKDVPKAYRLTEPYENLYRLSHPEYRGERIFCEYPGGPLYTANEIGRRMYQRYLASEAKTI